MIAGPVQNEAHAYACPQLAERGFFEEASNASAGTHRYPGLNLRMANTPNHIRTGPPLLGEHNEYVYREVMGYTEEQYRALEEIGQNRDGLRARRRAVRRRGVAGATAVDESARVVHCQIEPDVTPGRCHSWLSGFPGLPDPCSRAMSCSGG